MNKLKKYIADAWSFSLLNVSIVTMLAACHKYPFSGYLPRTRIWIEVLSLPFNPFCLPAKRKMGFGTWEGNPLAGGNQPSFFWQTASKSLFRLDAVLLDSKSQWSPLL